jgi:hypothetical protein
VIKIECKNLEFRWHLNKASVSVEVDKHFDIGSIGMILVRRERV